MRLSQRLRRDIVYGLAVTMVRLFNFLPRRVCLLIGSWIGLLASVLLVKDRYKAMRHLSLVYGDSLSVEERRRIVRKLYINAARNIADVIRFRDHFESEIKPLVTVEGAEHFKRAFDKGRGLIGVTGHIGNFELVAAWVASEGFSTAVIGRKMYDERLDRLLVENRKGTGMVNIATTDSPRVIVKWLKQGNALGVLIDNDSMRVRGTFVPMFNRLANTPIGQSVLGLRTGAAFVPMACVRTADDRYRLIFRPEVTIEPTGDQERDVYEITFACTRELERFIMEYPDQWIWFHNRWHTRPEPAA
jgi:KDO2-lipid IV(A) lauroyltransferase